MHCSATLTVGRLHGCGMATLAYEIKNVKIGSDIQKFAPTKISRYTIPWFYIKNKTPLISVWFFNIFN